MAILNVIGSMHGLLSRIIVLNRFTDRNKINSVQSDGQKITVYLLSQITMLINSFE